MKYSEFPVISAPSGLAIGGGFEIVVQSDYVVSHSNVVLGLVETLVGLVPAGGGCKEMLWRWMQAEEAKNDPNYGVKSEQPMSTLFDQALHIFGDVVSMIIQSEKGLTKEELWNYHANLE